MVNAIESYEEGGYIDDYLSWTTIKQPTVFLIQIGFSEDKPLRRKRDLIQVHGSKLFARCNTNIPVNSLFIHHHYLNTTLQYYSKKRSPLLNPLRIGPLHTHHLSTVPATGPSSIGVSLPTQ